MYNSSPILDKQCIALPNTMEDKVIHWAQVAKGSFLQTSLTYLIIFEQESKAKSILP